MTNENYCFSFRNKDAMKNDGHDILTSTVLPDIGNFGPRRIGHALFLNINYACVRDSPNGTIGSQWYHW